MSVDLTLHWSAKWVVLHTTERRAQAISGGEWGSITHTAGCFKRLQEWQAMTHGVLRLLVPGSGNNVPIHHSSVKEAWFSYQELRVELESINSTLKPGGKKSMLNINTGNNLTITQQQNTVRKDFIHTGKFVRIK